MQKVGFSEALEAILVQHPQYDRESYHFLRDALEHTVKSVKKGKAGTGQHVTPTELLDGVRQHALKEFGPMVSTVFEYWGIRNCEDIGKMVFFLIDAGVFGRNENDRPEDFKNGFDFYEAFIVPFQPEGTPQPRRNRGTKPTEKLA